MLLLYPFRQYIGYLLKAKDEHSVHSPFVFELYTNVIRPFKWYYSFDQIEDYREQLLRENHVIEVNDLGAGSTRLPTARRSIRQIARTSLSKPVIGQLLFKLVDYFSANVILELGTSLGINTLYLASVSQKANVFTFEGCPIIAQRAQKTFHDNKAENIEIIVGNLDETLPQTLDRLSTIDVAYLDANHRYEPTMRYFAQCLSKIHKNSLLVIGDIYWSPEMTKAWQSIKRHERVTVTIDLFDIGLVFFHQKQAKQNFILRF